MEKVTGLIESREVKTIDGRGQYAGTTSKKIALTIEGKNYSAFDNRVPSDVGERLMDIKVGDEVDLTFEDVDGSWQGRPVTYHNIKDIIKVDRVDKGVAPVSAQVETEVKEHFPYSMKVSYSKDTIISVITRGHINPAEGETEESFLARVFSLIKAGAKTLGE